MGKSSSPPSTTTTTTKSEPWKAQQEPYKYGFQQARDIYEQARGMPAYPPFSTVYPFTPEQIAGQQMALGYAGGMLPYLGETFGASSFGLNPLDNPLLQPLGQQVPETANVLGQYAERGLNPQISEPVQQMLTATPNMDVWGPLFNQVAQKGGEYFTEEVAPVLRQDALMTGNFGTPRAALAGQKALGRVSENVQQSLERLAQTAASEALQQRGLGAQIAETSRAAQAREGLTGAGTMMEGLGNIYSPTISAYRQALTTAPLIAQMGMMPADIYQQVGQQRQQMGQAQLDEAASRYFTERSAPWSDLTRYMNIIGAPVGTTALTQTSTPMYNNPAAAGLGTMMLLNPGMFGGGGGILPGGGGSSMSWLLPLMLFGL